MEHSGSSLLYVGMLALVAGVRPAVRALFGLVTAGVVLTILVFALGYAIIVTQVRSLVGRHGPLG